MSESRRLENRLWKRIFTAVRKQLLAPREQLRGRFFLLFLVELDGGKVWQSQLPGAPVQGAAMEIAWPAEMIQHCLAWLVFDDGLR